MTRRSRAIDVGLAGVLAVAPAFAVTADIAPEGSSVARVLASAEVACKATAPDAPATLQVAPEAITWTDLDGDGARDDAIVDFNAIYCSVSATLWHGTGGAPVHALTDAAEGGADHQWTGWGWQVVQHGDAPVLLISRHGTACDGGGTDPCVMAVTFSPTGAFVLTQP